MASDPIPRIRAPMFKPLENSCGRVSKNVDNTPWIGFSEERKDLLEKDDDSYTRHETGNDRVWDVLDVVSKPSNPENNLQDSSQQKSEDDHPEAFLHGPRDLFGRQDYGNRNQRHRRCGSADLRRSSAKERREKADDNRTIQSSRGSQFRLVTERERQGKSNNSRSQSAKQVALEVFEVHGFPLWL